MGYKVVQLTDTHLFSDTDGTQKGVNTCESLEKVVLDVADNHGDFDALLLTGDLSQDETPESYELLARLLAPIRGAPAYAIPGNHDDLAHMRAHLGSHGVSVLSDVLLGPWRIVMLNSQVPGRVHGELGADQRRRLRGVVGNGDEHVIVAVHHPPVAVQSAWIDDLRCLDGDEWLADIADPPVKAVVCGHVHQSFEATWRGTTVLTTPSTCVQFEPGSAEFAIDDVPPGYRILELEDDGRWSTRIRRVAC